MNVQAGDLYNPVCLKQSITVLINSLEGILINLFFYQRN